jgi:hypothetical protein
MYWRNRAALCSLCADVRQHPTAFLPFVRVSAKFPHLGCNPAAGLAWTDPLAPR